MGTRSRHIKELGERRCGHGATDNQNGEGGCWDIGELGAGEGMGVDGQVGKEGTEPRATMLGGWERGKRGTGPRTTNSGG